MRGSTHLDEGVDGLGGLEGAVGEVVEALHDVAHGREHAHAAVLQLSGAVPSSTQQFSE